MIWMAAVTALLPLGLQVGAATTHAPERCGVVVKQSDGSLKTTVDEQLKVVALTARDGPLAYAFPAGTQGVICGRSDIVPAQSDYKVLDAGYPLSLVKDERVLVLEISNGQLRVRVIAGELSGDEAERVQARLNQMQTAIQRDR